MIVVSLRDAITPVKFTGWFLFLSYRVFVSSGKGWDIVEMWQLVSLLVVVSIF